MAAGLRGRNDDGRRARGETEPSIEPGAAAGELVAAPAAPAAVAKADIGSRKEAGGAPGGEARRGAVVDGAGSATDVLSALVAVGDHDVLSGARDGAVDWLADVGDLGVGRGEPLVELVHADGAGDLQER